MDISHNLVITTDHLSKSYNGVTVLQNLNLKVARHSIFGFLGPNGAGKTTYHGVSRGAGMGTRCGWRWDARSAYQHLRRDVGSVADVFAGVSWCA